MHFAAILRRRLNDVGLLHGSLFFSFSSIQGWPPACKSAAAGATSCEQCVRGTSSKWPKRTQAFSELFDPTLKRRHVLEVTVSGKSCVEPAMFAFLLLPPKPFHLQTHETCLQATSRSTQPPTMRLSEVLRTCSL